MSDGDRPEQRGLGLGLAASARVAGGVVCSLLTFVAFASRSSGAPSPEWVVWNVILPAGTGVAFGIALVRRGGVWQRRLGAVVLTLCGGFCLALGLLMATGPYPHWGIPHEISRRYR